MMTIEEYAIKLAAEGVESIAENDENDENLIAVDDHDEACDLAIRIARAIRDHPDAVLALVSAGGRRVETAYPSGGVL
jgi:hypothetical protein